MHLTRRLLVIGTITCGALLAGAPAASAHAVLEHTTPNSGAVVRHSPTEVTLTFGEDVGVASDDVEVFDDHLRRVDLHDAGHLTGHGETVGVRLPAHLTRGTYTVTWRVISADSHPVSGGFTFSVGAPSKVIGSPPGLAGGHRSVGVLLGAMRFLGYLGLAITLGGLMFMAIWRLGREETRIHRLVRDGVAAGIVSTAGLFVVQAPYAQGKSLTHLLDGNLLDQVAHSHDGHVLIVRMALWLVVAAVTTVMLRGAWRAAWPLVPVLAALPVTWAYAGHGDIGSQVSLSLASESLHVLAVSIWMGGLLVVATHLLRRTDRAVIFDVLPRFSTVALACVGIILVTGLYQAWREIGLSWTALITTTYGRLVAAKILGLVALIGLGAFARQSLRTVGASDEKLPPVSVRQRVIHAHLRQSVLLELEIGTVVLVLTSVLVNTVPARESVVYTEHRDLRAPGLQVYATMSPSRVGSGTIDLTIFTAEGYPRLVKSVTGSLSLPTRGLSSLPVTFTQVPTQNKLTATASFPYPGQWSLSFDVQTSAIDITHFTTEFDVH